MEHAAAQQDGGAPQPTGSRCARNPYCDDGTDRGEVVRRPDVLPEIPLHIGNPYVTSSNRTFVEHVPTPSVATTAATPAEQRLCEFERGRRPGS